MKILYDVALVVGVAATLFVTLWTMLMVLDAVGLVSVGG